MIRRAYAYSSRRSLTASVYNERTGFEAGSEELNILRSIIVEFAETATRNHSLPIVFIVNNLHTSDHLYTALEPTLASQNILFLSTHKICPPNDPRYYLPDSHFLPKKNAAMAKEIIKIVRENALPAAAQGGNEGDRTRVKAPAAVTGDAR